MYDSSPFLFIETCLLVPDVVYLGNVLPQSKKIVYIIVFEWCVL